MNWLDLGSRILRRSLLLQGVRSSVVQVRGTQVHSYCATGRGLGPPVVLVHGLGSSANGFFRTLLPLTATFRQVWALDLPGYGFSPIPPGGPLAVRELVEVLLEFRRAVVGEPVFLVGNSLGGGLSLFAAALEPAGFVGLALVSPAGARLEAPEFERRLRAFRVEDAGDARGLAKRLFATPSWPLLLFADQLRAMMGSPAVKHVVASLSIDDVMTEAMLARLTMPVLLLWGRNEKVLPREALAYFRAHLPVTAEVDEVEAFGHVPQLEHPRALVERLARFARERLSV